jgi:alanine dehydrogenase
MKIGVPKEIKPQENRIGLTPESVKTLTSNGHKVLIENNGGFEAGFENNQYIKAGASIVNEAGDIFNDSEIIVKVKEPLTNEVKMIRENQIVFTYLHLAAAKELTSGLIKSKSICIAYETVTDDNGRLPLLAPMSAVAGRMSIQAGAHSLEKNQKGRGLLLGGAPGVEPATVIILGGGVVGENAALIATGMKAKVHILDKSQERLNQLKKIFGDMIIPQLSDKTDLKKLISDCDLLIGGVLIPGAEAPKLVTKKMLKLMKRGSVIVDVAIDQGGCVETSKPTTHANPTYIVDDIVHYCVANMPGGVPRTSTLALNKATIPFLSKLADKGYEKALKEDKNFLAGLNVFKGQITYKAVADTFGSKYTSPAEVLGVRLEKN